MSEKSNESIQLVDVLAMFEVLERRLSRLENSFDIHRQTVDTMSDNVYSMYKTLMSFKADLVRLDDMEADINYLYTLTHGGDNFCGNCEHCVSCPDGLYRCDLTNLELDLDTSSCIRFESPQKKFDSSDAEICKACSDKDTPRCYKCSHFPF